MRGSEPVGRNIRQEKGKGVQVVRHASLTVRGRETTLL